ncbi:MAG TPA: MBL fold metallo-hydrolase [Anaeromyxobacteraceae bacterium]|nr:MBL fold metallo-hydrolase [Anaeromyxobacteraceae bacterium]
MALLAHRLPENAPGDLFVDASCIACDTCRRVAPGVYGGGPWDRATVARQPASAAEWHRALMSLVSCPVSAIGTTPRRPAAEAARAARAFPDPVDVAAGVYQCGYAAESSFGAASWLVVRPGGNVLVDSPRFARPLLRGIERLRGARWLFLTHRDDVADHARWAEALGCERILHARDVSRATAGVERLVEGGDPVALAPDLLLVPVPGHTAGSLALLYRERWLFTGDHLWAGADGRLEADRDVCWHSWSEQTRSMQRLLDLRFEAVLPGHGRPWRAGSPAKARAEVARVVRAMESGSTG